MTRVFVGVGSNINPADNVRRAICLLGRKVRILGISTFYLTEALGRPHDLPFYNGVVAVEIDLPPTALKESALRRIEQEMGRRWTEDKYAPRVIDLDILFYEGQADSVDSEIGMRPFLAIPLYELSPDLMLPGLGAIKDIAGALSNNDMKPLSEFTEQLRIDIERHIDEQAEG